LSLSCGVETLAGAETSSVCLVYSVCLVCLVERN
jgi:hypothetical protein